MSIKLTSCQWYFSLPLEDQRMYDDNGWRDGNINFHKDKISHNQFNYRYTQCSLTTYDRARHPFDLNCSKCKYFNRNQVTRTSCDWYANLYPSKQIIYDNDGWRDGKIDFHRDKITKDEFDYRYTQCSMLSGMPRPIVDSSCRHCNIRKSKLIGCSKYKIINNICRLSFLMYMLINK